MFKRKLFLSGILATVMSLVVAGCTPAEIQALQGTLQNIDSVSGNVTVKLKDGTTQSFNLTDVKVDTVRQALGKASLEIGDQIVVKARKNGGVEGVETEKAEIGGVIQSLGTNNVTITTQKQGNITLTVTPNTTIRIEGNVTANFSSLKVGQRVEVKYDVSTKTAFRINVNIEEATGQAAGVIQAVNNSTKTVTITTNKSGNITLTVTSNTSIRVEDKGTATFADLKVGQRIEARYDVATKTAIKLMAENIGKDEGQDRGKGKDQGQDRGKDKDQGNDRDNDRGR